MRMRDTLLLFVRSIYNDWHGCALKKRMRVGKGKDKHYLPVGRLCDQCHDMSEAYVDDMIKELSK